MLSTKFGFYPRIIQLASKTYSHSKYDFNLQKSSHLPLACIYTLRNKYQETLVCAIKNNVNYNARVQMLPNFLKYSTKPIEVPPYIPQPPPAETEVFGTIGGLQYESIELDKEELKEEEKSKNSRAWVPRKFKPSPGQYAKMIKNYIEKGDLISAEEVISECRLNRDKPTDYMFTLLIRAFAIQGDIRKCYRYYSDMKTRHFKMKPNVFTSLFNACANSPDSEKALDYFERAKKYMAKIQMPINHAHYNVMVKVYGRHKKLEEANKLVQEMMDKKLKIGISTLNSLMYAANSNTESGLKHVLYVWQLMRKQGIPPDIFSYHLLLRAIRDTHFGGCTINELLLPDTEYSAIITDNNRPDLLLYPPVISSLPLDNIHRKESPKFEDLLSSPESKSADPSKSSESTNSEISEVNQEVLPASIANLDLDAILAQNKLILFGGVNGLLQKMKNDRVEPNIKTITFLIELVPDSIAAEEAIIKYAKSEHIPLDIDFYNMLIRKRSLRGAKNEARAVIDDIHKADLRPNIVTYGVLALTCSTASESRELLQAMKATGHTINKYVADSLLNAAFLKLDFGFILELMELMRYERIRLGEETFDKLDKFQQKMTEYIKTKHRYADTDKFKLGFSKFNMRYKGWQEDMGRVIVTERQSKEK